MAKGVQCMAYMDDLVIMVPSKAEALRQQATVLKTISSLGWHINYEKSSLEPSQSKEFLGLTVNTSAKPCFQVPVEKSHALKHDIERLLWTHDKAGLVPLLLCNLYHDIKRRWDWSSAIQLSLAAINDLQEWMTGLLKWDGHMVTTQPFNVVLNTNTSLTGWGAALKDLSAISAGWWRGWLCHINELELKAVLRAL